MNETPLPHTTPTPPAPEATATAPRKISCESIQCAEKKKKIHPYRVFISYSHQDQALAKALKEHLLAAELFPIMDYDIRVGEAFSEEIREMIECAHVFMPLVTANANERLWVQQEIGYAAAMHVPVCPIAIGDLPAGMAEHIQGIHIAEVKKKPRTDKEIMAIVAPRLTYAMLDDLVRRACRRHRQGRYDCALNWTDRQELLATLTEAAYRSGCRMVRDHEELNKPGQEPSPALDRGAWRLRQCAAFGSFSIPDANVSSELWEKRDPQRYLSHFERRLLRQERRQMEKFAQCFGCDLILDPRIDNKLNTVVNSDASNQASVQFKHSNAQTALRIELIQQFITSHQDNDRIRVVIPKPLGTITTNLYVVGDWFAAEAVVPLYTKSGYERTIFTRHAPTVLNMIERFDQDFEDALTEAGFPPDDPQRIRNAKVAVLRQLAEWLTKLDSKAD